MFGELSVRWIVWAIVVFVALRSLASLSILLRDRLQGLLVDYIKLQQAESQKRQRIKELREKIRMKKSDASAQMEAEIKKAA